LLAPLLTGLVQRRSRIALGRRPSSASAQIGKSRCRQPISNLRRLLSVPSLWHSSRCWPAPSGFKQLTTTSIADKGNCARCVNCRSMRRAVVDPA